MPDDADLPGDVQVRRDLKNLLRFTEELLSTRDKVVFDISEYSVSLTKHDFLGKDGAPLPGVTFGPPDAGQSENAWLSFSRLSPRPPPPAQGTLAPWLRAEPHPAPGREPALLAERIVEVAPGEATDLIDAGLVEPDAVYPLDGEPPGATRWAVPLRPAELPDVAAAHRAYIDGPWRAWSISEAPRRKTIGTYEEFFKAHAQISAAGGEGSQELVVGLGIARWQCDGQRIVLPLIEQRAELELDDSNGTLTIQPRSVPPAPALTAFAQLGLPGVSSLQREMAVRLEEIARDQDVDLRPSDPSSFRSVLETCAARLDASGVVLTPEEDPGPPTAVLRISPTFCVIVRARRDDLLRDDLRRLAEAMLDEEAPIPETARRFVVPLSDKAPDHDVPISSGWPQGGGWAGTEGNASTKGKRRRIFFPLAANDEQEQIVRCLEEENVAGVVVQGPPGTGKTHSIANIIGHSMPEGRRVLVSAHTAEALTAIREKLPEGLRDLTISVTQSDREGARQLEQAVSALAARVLSLDQPIAVQRIQGLLQRIGQADVRVAEIDGELASIAQANLTRIGWRGRNALPQEIAAWTASQADRHDWLRDPLDLTAAYEPRFGNAEIEEARRIRRRLGNDLAYKPDHLLAAATNLPRLGDVVTAHHALRAAAERDERESSGRLPRLDLAATTPSEMAELLDWLVRLSSWRDGCREHPWMPEAWEVLAGGSGRNGIAPSDLRPRLEEAARLSKKGEEVHLLAAELADIPQVARLEAALARLAGGRRPFGPFRSLGRNPVRAAVAAARIAGQAPRDASGWTSLLAFHTWRGEVRRFAAVWNAFAGQHSLTRLPEDHTDSRAALRSLGRSASVMLTLAARAQTHLERIRVLFPCGPTAEAVVLRIDVALAIEALRANLGEAERKAAKRLREDLRARGEKVAGRFGEALCELAENLGTADATDGDVASRWNEIRAEARRLAELRDDMLNLCALSARVRENGAERWADRIAREPPGATDIVLPADWRDAWDYARARGFLARVADRARADALAQERADVQHSRERQFLEVIEVRTHLGLQGRMTPSVQTALRGYLAALARLPKTPGARTAARFRRILRGSLRSALKAMPCWIMPEWRVSEQLPPDLGGFDLVIIDEASQSNIMALPVVLRGKKVLIVGDDKQVSPSVVGLEQVVIDRLRAIHLKGQPLAEHIDPATSLYELGCMMYPGKVIMLREHFRCVEPIIRFSSRYYPGGLLPLRLPKPSERLDPPLVDILVDGGRRRGEVNEAEAEAIVAEIKCVIADPNIHAAGRRSIGVISLHAKLQANLIYNMLFQAIGPSAISKHRILCGDAATFQGQERDIVFLSMVHDADTAKAQSSLLFQQRYNVALSRARDRMILVRSLTTSNLKAGDIKREVLEHFQNRTGSGNIQQSDDELGKCESVFEREVGKRLLEEGYRVHAQVPAGSFRIDFVVEGGDDRRLAVELDGDAFHGPERWAEDIRRQKALERVGWTFWRCWASEWEAEKDSVFSDLVATLQRHGIGPIGGAAKYGGWLVENHRVRARAEPERSAHQAPRPAGEGTVKSGATASTPPTTTAHPPPSAPLHPAEKQAVRAEQSLNVQVGDQVRVRYANGRGRTATVQIVAAGIADGRGRIAPSSPLARAILGHRVEDEAEIEIDGTLRPVVIEEIRRQLQG